ncbi:Crossover junction endonuclease mus81 [Rhizophlyctis rosea]|uniref:Crossover junction endonuclease MUS81 n=1 Tax=Rhizophlyctis rosea TaxID=64517 RepID=A0AAD5S7H4_9FUNG|nr:Crossover junction endonuclease mus81 [Rhizophlyctis rosea]
MGRHGVRLLTRALELGDFIWVAKERAGEEREVVLDYIVERKTMDDLVMSIKDGRYKEQKFRLANTTANVTYLLEESTAPDPTFKDAVETVMAQLPVLHGFTLKRTSTKDDTAHFLAAFTQKIAQLYERTDLYALYMRDVDIATVTDALTTKSKNLQLQDVWTKQLMSVRGVSGEKASKIVMRYPTMRSLLDRLAGCRNDAERLSVLACDQTGKAAIGPALCQKILEIVWAPSYKG